MARPVRVRNLARNLGIDEETLMLWLIDHASDEEALHPAAFVSAETAARAREALGPKVPPGPPQVARCTDCAQAPRPPGTVVREVAAAECERCEGSDNRRAVCDLIDACAVARCRRLVVVGGGPSSAEDLRDLVGDALDLRFVAGDGHVDATDAEAQLAWADVVAIWGGTILDHKVSRLFTDPLGHRDKVVRLARRGVAALCHAIVEHLHRQAPKTS